MHILKYVSLFSILVFSFIVYRYASGTQNDDSTDPQGNDWSSNATELTPEQPPDVSRYKRHPRIRQHHTREISIDEIEITTLKPEKLSEREIIEKILRTDDYDWRVRPIGLNTSYGDTGGPVKVTVNIYLRSISKIDDVNMEYSAQFTFRETWVDRRLAYERMKSATTTVPNFIVLALGDSSQQIWMPDTFFQNEKEARKHMIDKPNVMIRIYPNGEILYSVRLSMVLSCPMSLEYYPLDEQRCLIELASYAYTTDDIEYEWKNDTPVQQKDGLGRSLPSFELQAVRTGYCTSMTNTGRYSCLRTELILRREFSYYLLQLYIPSFMLVIVSWVSFWLDKDSVPARVTLGVTTLLTMTTQSSGINAKLPPVSYTKAIDVWIGVCLAFIFGALLEFALVNYAARKDIMRNVSNVVRRGRRPGVSAGSAIPAEDPSAENPADVEAQCRTQPPQQQTAEEQQHNYNTFMMVMRQPYGSAKINASTDGGGTAASSAAKFSFYVPPNYTGHGGGGGGGLPSLVPARNVCDPRADFCASANACLMLQNPLTKQSPIIGRHQVEVLPPNTRTTTLPPKYHYQSGSYSCLRTELILRREYSYYLIQLYIPSFMLVVVSWVNFWIDKDSVPARVSLGVTTLLTMTTQASGANAKLPPVSYTKAIDVWIGVCLAFIFGALLEFALVNYAGRVEFMDKERKKQKKVVNPTLAFPQMANFNIPSQPTSSHYIPQAIPSTSGLPVDVICPQCDAEREERLLGFARPLSLDSPPRDIPKSCKFLKAASPRRTVNWFNLWLSKYKERSKRIDVISRLVFPVAFFFFNCLYWTAYVL